MEDTDWRSPQPQPLEHIKLYVLKDWDGGDGMFNSANGYITKNNALAEAWKKQNTGSSYQTITGILVETMQDFESAHVEREKQKAMDKLTPRERELLGLAPNSIDEKLVDRIGRSASTTFQPTPSTSYDKPGQK